MLQVLSETQNKMPALAPEITPQVQDSGSRWTSRAQRNSFDKLGLKLCSPDNDSDVIEALLTTALPAWGEEFRILASRLVRHSL